MILDDFRLDGRVALVTGAGTGLGAALAVGLAEAGAELALVTRRTPLEETAAAITSHGRQAFTLQANLEHPADREAAIDSCLQRFGKLDILVNNAGITDRHKAEDFPLQSWENVMNTNATAAFHLCQIAGRHMLERGRGKIINLASLLSFSGGILAAPYAASKGAVAQFTKALAKQMGVPRYKRECDCSRLLSTPHGRAALHGSQAHVPTARSNSRRENR